MAPLSAYCMLSHIMLSFGSSSWTDAARPTPHFYKPVKTFSHLAGSRRGDNVAGVRDVKGYLQRFGYLNYPEGKTLDDTFDDSLEQALLTYQDFYQLNKTGLLDDETVSLMSKPRCGNPDIIRNVNATGQPHYEFPPDKLKRTTDKVYVWITDSVPAELGDPIGQAVRDWEPFIPLVFIVTRDGGEIVTDNIQARFFKGDHDDGYPFDGPGKTLAHATAGQGTMFHFDAEENWKVGAVPDAYDVATVARHEAGHSLGLGHSADKNALMYAYVGTGEVKQIADDDIAGVRALYYGS